MYENLRRISYKDAHQRAEYRLLAMGLQTITVI